MILTTFFISDIDHDELRKLSDGLSYGVIVDCGSSGSRAHIFKWKKNPVSNRIEIVRDSLKGKHITPGLSSLKDDPDKASDYLEPIMEFISEAIPQHKHTETPVHFMATAGLRLQNDATQQAILGDIDRDLRAKFNFPKLKSQVISGEKEGVYSWISLNMNKDLRSSAYSRTYGMIEMGGASTQVAFEVDQEVERYILNSLNSDQAKSAFKQEQILLDVGSGNSIRLFATTFLGLGVNSAREAAIDLLVKDYLDGSNKWHEASSNPRAVFESGLHDPCLPMKSSETILRPTAMLHKSVKTIGFVIKPSEQTFEVKLIGGGDFFSCMSLLERVIKIAKTERMNCPSNKQACAMDLLGTEFIPYVRYPFIGLSEMFFTTNEMMNSAGLFNRSHVLHETKRICGSEYNKLLDTYAKSSAPDERVLSECFKASWLLTILHSSGLNMPVEYDDFRTVDQIDGEEIDWTTGAMIMEVALKG